MGQDLQGTWDHSPPSYCKVPVSSPVFSFTITLWLTFISNFQERRNPNLKLSRIVLARRRKKSLKMSREGGGWNQGFTVALLTSLLWSQFKKVNNLSLGKLWEVGGGNGWWQSKERIARSRSPFGSQITGEPLIPGTLGLPPCGGWVGTHCQCGHVMEAFFCAHV